MQLKMFGTCPESSTKSRLWERLRQEERTTLIARLARLMAKAIRPVSRRSEDE